MNSSRPISPWLAALIAWVVAVVLVVGVYAWWRSSHGQPVDWEIARKAVLIASPIALLQLWRDRAKP